MLNNLKSYALSLLHPNPRYKGLQIVVVGFIVSLVGAAIALGGDVFADEVSAASLLRFSKAMAYFGAVIMGLGALTMITGIVLHWLSTLRDDADR